jgi:hypothetical protein
MGILFPLFSGRSVTGLGVSRCRRLSSTLHTMKLTWVLFSAFCASILKLSRWLTVTACSMPAPLAIAVRSDLPLVADAWLMRVPLYTPLSKTMTVMFLGFRLASVGRLNSDSKTLPSDSRAMTLRCGNARASPTPTPMAQPMLPNSRLPSCWLMWFHSMRCPLCDVVTRWSVIMGASASRHS